MYMILQCFFWLFIFFCTITSQDVNRALPIGFDVTAVESPYSVFIDGDLSVSGTISPLTGGGSIGNAKKRNYVFPAQSMVNRLSTNIDSKFTSVYPSKLLPIGTWRAVRASSSQRYIGIAFQLPAEFDKTVNPSLEVLFGVQNFGLTGQVMNIAVDIDSIASGNQIGESAPATGVKQTVTSGNISITEPTGSSNLRIYQVSLPLNGSLLNPNDLFTFFIYRTAPTSGTDYNNDVYIISANFNFQVT